TTRSHAETRRRGGGRVLRIGAKRRKTAEGSPKGESRPLGKVENRKLGRIETFGERSRIASSGELKID
ncbi:hypothetical protein EBU02_12845, partial [bacterium]|nr:hypothetical protein [bacterium]